MPNKIWRQNVDNIPYSLAYRLKRIVSTPTTFDQRLTELKQNLLDRKYKKKVIDDAFKRVKLISREEALKKELDIRKQKGQFLL